MVRQVQPLRISKGSLSSVKQDHVPRKTPLAELAGTSPRRNSPSYNQQVSGIVVMGVTNRMC